MNAEQEFENKLNEFEEKEALKGANVKLINTGKFKKHKEKVQTETYI